MPLWKAQTAARRKDFEFTLNKEGTRMTVCDVVSFRVGDKGEIIAEVRIEDIADALYILKWSTQEPVIEHGKE